MSSPFRYPKRDGKGRAYFPLAKLDAHPIDGGTMDQRWNIVQSLLNERDLIFASADSQALLRNILEDVARYRMILVELLLNWNEWQEAEKRLVRKFDHIDYAPDRREAISNGRSSAGVNVHAYNFHKLMESLDQGQLADLVRGMEALSGE